MGARGFTLFEIILVFTILGFVAVVSLPMLSSGNPQSLQVAAHAATNAIRFARHESIRTGKPHGIDISPSSIRIRVFRANTGTSPWTPIYDVYHPLTKTLYDTDLGSQTLAGVDSMTSSSSYQAACTGPDRFVFDARGMPLCSDPETVLLLEYQLTLSQGAHSQQVTLSELTGRVSIQ